MTIAKPYPSDPSMRETRVADGEALPVTAPTAAPGGDPSPNSVRAREEGLGVKPSVVEDNLAALDVLAAAEAAAAEAAAEAPVEKVVHSPSDPPPAKKRAPRKAPAKKAAAKKAAK